METMLSTVVLSIVCFLAVLQNSAGQQADLKLINGTSNYLSSGRVEVYVYRRWGTICGDGFGAKEAQVICRTLGYHGETIPVYDSSYYGQGRGRIWKLTCTGEEDSIFDCGVTEDRQCSHRKDVGVECYRPQPAPPVRLTCPYNQTCNNIARKRGPDPGECTPSVHVEGIVEVYYNERWWPVSADEWDDEDVNVVCGQLGYPVSFGTVSKLAKILPRGTRVSREQKKQFRKSHLRKVTLQDVGCTGTERDLSLCPHHGWGPFDNPGGKVATARCGFHPHPSCVGECQQPSYRLRAGVMPWMGRVEMLYNKQWGTVCDDGFGDNSANVLCRSLGYGNVVTITKRAGYGRGIGKIWLSDVKCDGTEHWLHDCQHSPWEHNGTTTCKSHAGDVGVECSAPDIYYGQTMPMQFLATDNAKDSYSHYVEVSGDSDELGLLCYDDNTDAMLAKVLCRSLPNPSFLSSFQASSHTSYKGQRYSGKFICNGDEMNIRECDMELNLVPSCYYGDLLIRCDRGAPDLVPDLSVFELSLKSSFFRSSIFSSLLVDLKCAQQEGCLASDANNATYGSIRTLLRFDSLTMNYGVKDFTPLLDPSEWIWHACHNHSHSFEAFVAYDLLDLNGTKVAEGHKASFCLQDTFCDAGGHRRHLCSTSTQGISRNCGDLYARYLDCQWIDITGVPSGTYNLQNRVNPYQLAVESNYHNNLISCTIVLNARRRSIKVIRCSHSDYEVTTC